MSEEIPQLPHLFKAPVNTPVRARFMSAVEDAAVDVRKVCNAIKKLSRIAAASVVSGYPHQHLQQHVEEISIEILERLGYSTNDQHRMGVLLAMLSEPVASLVAEAALAGATFNDMRALAPKLVAGIIDIAKSPVTSKMAADYYPSDMDSAAALRVSVSTSMAMVAVEFRKFDFYIGVDKCIKEASTVIMKSTFEAVSYLVTKHTSASSRLVLTQSLLASNSNLYATCARVEAERQRSIADNLSETEVVELRLAGKKIKPEVALAAVKQTYLELLDLNINIAAEVPTSEVLQQELTENTVQAIQTPIESQTSVQAMRRGNRP